MSKLHLAKKLLSFVTCTAISAGLVVAYPVINNRSGKASARTLQEIQEEREANQQKINEYQNQLDALAGDKANEEAYQKTLNEQIDLIRQNITSLNVELESINSDIDASKANIDKLDKDIAEQQNTIDNKIKDFKERLYSMYVSGDDNLAAVILGSSSFYDTLSNIEMVNRIAAYDEDLINQLLDDIDALGESKKQLETEKLTLEMKLDSQEVKKKEKEEELKNYNEKMAQTKEVLDRIALEESMLANNKEELEKYQDSLDAEDAAIREQIKREQEEAQRRYEEEQRRIAEEKAAAEAAARAEQDRIAREQQQNNNDDNSGQEQQQQQQTPEQEPVTYSTAPSASGFIWPAPGFCYISSPFGPRWGRNHNGIDIGDGGIGGGVAVASKAGTVVAVDNTCTHDCPKNYTCCGSGYGNYVVISHDGTYSTLYGHLRYATVSVGDYVQAGQRIGVIGCTGYSTGDHLHFEVRVNGAAQDPRVYVSP
ncbi:MAG: peptidoglycan DD-metalloendopeptidase family protein [Ruminococcus sp.]|nr:peptidoglycan DD-metalloendopeptidase family protein [Ruminococcus sp.]